MRHERRWRATSGRTLGRTLSLYDLWPLYLSVNEKKNSTKKKFTITGYTTYSMFYCSLYCRVLQIGYFRLKPGPIDFTLGPARPEKINIYTPARLSNRLSSQIYHRIYFKYADGEFRLTQIFNYIALVLVNEYLQLGLARSNHFRSGPLFTFFIWSRNLRKCTVGAQIIRAISHFYIYKKSSNH